MRVGRGETNWQMRVPSSKLVYLINDAAVSLKLMGRYGPIITVNLLLGVLGHLARRGRLSSLETKTLAIRDVHSASDSFTLSDLPPQGAPVQYKEEGLSWLCLLIVGR